MSTTVVLAPPTAKPLTSYRKYWAKRFGTAPFLPTSRAEMDALGWDSCDIVIVTGDAYVDHPSFGMAVIGRMLEAQGFRVGIIAQPDWQSAEPFKALGQAEPVLRRHRRQHGFDDQPLHRRPQDPQRRRLHARRRRRQAAGPRVASSMRSAAAKPSTTCRSCSAASKARCAASRTTTTGRTRCAARSWSTPSATCCCTATPSARSSRSRTAWRAREPVAADHRRARHRLRARATTPRGLVRDRFDRASTCRAASTTHVNPYLTMSDQAKAQGETCAQEDGAAGPPPRGGADQPHHASCRTRAQARQLPPRDRTRDPPAVVRAGHAATRCCTPTPTACCTSKPTPATRARWCRRTATRDVWLNPPPIPLTTAEMDHVFDLPYARAPHPRYADEHGSHDGATKIPAWEMIRFCVNIMRGCFGGCTFCSITEHEGRIIQSRTRRLGDPRDRGRSATRSRASPASSPTSAGRPPTCTASAARRREIEAACRKPSCVYPGICPNLNTDHGPLIKHVPPRARAEGRQEDPDRLRPALRPGRAVARVREGTGARTTSAAT